MIEASIVSGLLILVIGVNFFHRQKLAKRRALKRQRGISQLSQILELIQRIQRHRGLCANLSGENLLEQRRLSQEINHLWTPLLDTGYGGNKNRIKIQQKNWQKICDTPESSFMPHCLLIEKLLYELTIIADTCSLTAVDPKADHQDIWQNVLQRPHFAETLGRLRALGNKAASLGECPADVRIQLLYQLQNLKQNPLDRCNTGPIVSLIQDEILAPEKIEITPQAYFTRLTQAIDEQLQITREHLNQLN